MIFVIPKWYTLQQNVSKNKVLSLAKQFNIKVKLKKNVLLSTMGNSLQIITVYSIAKSIKRKLKL